MKDIADFFSGPTEKNTPEKQKGTPGEAYEVEKVNEKHAENSSEESSVLANIENCKSSDQNIVKVKKNRKKPKTRKRSDPLIKNITDLHSNTLHLISPNNSSFAQPTIIMVDKAASISDNKIQADENCLKVTAVETPPSKPNAFEFLMESRNKIIGSNSPGKDMKDVPSDIKPNKEKLTARKNLLNSWCEKKGASKRKRAEEDLDEIINHKLDKRAKRLKKLLKADSKQKENDQVNTKRRKRIKRIKSVSSNSENSSDVVKQKSLDIDESKMEINFKGDVRAGSVELSSDESNSTKHNEANVKGESNISNMCDNKYENIEKSDNLSPEKLLSKNNPKAKERKSLLNFFEVVNKAKNSEQFSSEERVSSEKQFETSKATENVDESKPKRPIRSKNNSISVHREKLEKRKLKQHSKHHNSEKGRQEPRKLQKGRNKIIKSNFKHKTGSLEESTTIADVKPSTNGNIDETMFSNRPMTAETKTSKSKKKSKIKIKSTIPKTVDESSLESLGAPRRLRSWKMKIKINLEEQKADEKLESVKKSNYVEDTSDYSDEDVYETKIEMNVSESKSDAKQILFNDDFEVIKSSETRKVAPIFMKAAPKPKIDPKVLEAKKEFLMSGMPLSLKKTVEKQSLEDKEYDIFPSISHVQQKCDSIFWNIPKPELNLKEFSPSTAKLPIPVCSQIISNYVNKKLNMQIEVQKGYDINILINKIKADNPEYPVYKSYRHISEKCIHNAEVKVENKLLSKKRKSKKRQRIILDSSIEMIESEKINVDLSEHAMWTEKYAPKSSEEIIGNMEAVKNLKNWLETWRNFSKEINSKRRRNSSSSEFETTDDSRDSARLPGNTMVLGGPCGSGKTSAVYAICNELGFNIIELNASSKRTGKMLILELQEATQSHQVRETDSTNIQIFLQTTEEEKYEPKKALSNRKMCVLLVEDIDIVFKQDDGFISSLTQLIATSKRPIILTTTDFNSVFVQKFLNQYEHTEFLPLSTYTLATWLQILCLVEGIYADREDIGSLLELNRGDVRKTILELQFWVQSGGEIMKYKRALKIDNKRFSVEEKLVEDDETKLEEISKDIEDLVVHKNCIRCFEIFENDRPFVLPYYLNLGLFWWNVPNILNIPNFSQERYEKLKLENKTKLKQVSIEQTESSFEDKQKLSAFSKLYDVVCSTDVLFRKVNYFETLEPEVTNYVCYVKDSAELTEKMNGFDIDMDFVHDVTHYLVDGCIREYNNDTENLHSSLDVAVPNIAEKRWRAKHHACEAALQEALSFSTRLDRKSTVLDYLPTLRGITRSENHRAANNLKRGKRFRNYLKNLGVNCYQNNSQVAGNILRECDL